MSLTRDCLIRSTKIRYSAEFLCEQNPFIKILCGTKGRFEAKPLDVKFLYGNYIGNQKQISSFGPKYFKLGMPNTSTKDIFYHIMKKKSH